MLSMLFLFLLSHASGSLYSEPLGYIHTPPEPAGGHERQAANGDVRQAQENEDPERRRAHGPARRG